MQSYVDPRDRVYSPLGSRGGVVPRHSEVEKKVQDCRVVELLTRDISDSDLFVMLTFM